MVIATRQRPALLRRCLDSLAAQDRPADAVVVVDDGSGPATREVLFEFADRLPLSVITQPQPAGPAAARNAGWRAMSTSLIAFTDDDCRPDRAWISHLLGASAAATVVAGRTIPDPLDRPAGSVFDRTMRIENSEQARRYSTCNILYPTAVLADLGGFDESLAYYGEDTDLGWRAEAAGARLAFADGATVYHAVLRQGPWRALRERWRVGGIVRLVERHPGLRDELWEGHFWSRQHRQATLAWVGLLAAPLNPVTVAALAPWVRFARHRLVYHLSAQPRRRRLVDMAGLFALDSVEVAACATASIRRRTFFL